MSRACYTIFQMLWHYCMCRIWATLAYRQWESWWFNTSPCWRILGRDADPDCMWVNKAIGWQLKQTASPCMNGWQSASSGHETRKVPVYLLFVLCNRWSPAECILLARIWGKVTRLLFALATTTSIYHPHWGVFFLFFESFVSLNKIYACVPALGRRRRDVQRAARQLCFCCRWLPIKRCTPLASGGAASQVNMRVNELQCHNIYLSYISEIYICWQVKCDAILPHMPYIAEYEALTRCLYWRTLTKQNGYRADIVLTFLKSKKILQKKSNKPHSCRIPTGHHSTEQRTFAFFYLVVKYVCGH